MNIEYTKSYDNTLKKIKKHRKEYKNLEDIKLKITNHNSFQDLCNNPIMTTIYNFKRLKYKNNEFWSFNLEKNGGVIRLIVKPAKDNKTLIFVYISYNHYKDFSPNKIKFYDE